ELDTWVAFLPVDWAAWALVCLALDGSGQSYHLCHPRPISLREFARRLNLRQVPLGEFVTQLEAWSENALHPLLPLFREARGRRGESEAELSKRLPRFEARNVLADLARLHPKAASVPEMSVELLGRYLAFLERTDPMSK